MKLPEKLKAKVNALKKAVYVILLAALAAGALYFAATGLHKDYAVKNDGIRDTSEEVDVDSIYLGDTGSRVTFSEVILSPQQETRKLVVSTQEAEVSYTVSQSVIEQIDLEVLRKTQCVTYKGIGYFVVDLDSLTESDLIEDTANKTLTICIGHAYLETVAIDPEKIMIGETQNGLFAFGDLKLTVSDFNDIEKELSARLKEKFNTAENGQKADDIALDMVREVYEPVVKAVNSSYSVEVRFK